MTISNEVIVPDWPAPVRVRSLSTIRGGGVSRGVFSSLNLGTHVGDDPSAVAANRSLVVQSVGCEPVWLDQVHGTRVLDVTSLASIGPPPKADASFTKQAGTACVVMTADCLPVLFCDDAGTVVAAVHAGWRGLLAGVLEATIAAMNVPAGRLMAWLGPAIGPQAFEVGDEVRSAFVACSEPASLAFKPAVEGKWLADIYLLARQRLALAGVEQVFGGQYCTVTDAQRFFSYRRDGQTGRMASFVWLDG